MGKRYSEDFLLSELKRFYNEFGRSPQKDDLGEKNGYPSSTPYQRFGGLGNALKLAGLPRNTYHGISKQDMIDIVNAFYEENERIPNIDELPFSNTSIYKYFNNYIELIKYCGYKVKESGLRKNYTKEDLLKHMASYVSFLGRLPQKKDFEIHSFEPGLWYYYKNFNGIENCLIELGFLKPKLTKEQKVKHSIKQLQELAKKLNKCPTVEEYDNIDGAYARRVLENHLKMSYSEICKTYIPEYELNIIKKPKEQLLKELNDLKNKLGRTPYKYELTKENGVSTETAYRNVFNMTYNQIVESQGWELSGHTFTLKSDEEMLEDYYNFFQRLGRIPTSYDIADEKNLGSYVLYKKRFGSIENICNLLNIDFSQYNSSFAGIICKDKLNRICKSKPEQLISNFFIDNNIEHEKEFKYSLILNNQQDNRRCDWIVKYNNKTYYIEYFGLWDNRKKINYKNKTKKKIKDLYKAGLIDYCIFVFPDDLKNKFLDNIFKKFKNSLENAS